MTAEQDGLDLAAVLAEHVAVGGSNSWCRPCSGGGPGKPWPCLPYRLAALALDLQGKVARVEAASHEFEQYEDDDCVCGQRRTAPVHPWTPCGLGPCCLTAGHEGKCSL